jgi:hypothetical protein
MSYTSSRFCLGSSECPTWWAAKRVNAGDRSRASPVVEFTCCDGATDLGPALHPTPRLRVQTTRCLSEAKPIVGRGHDHGAD